MTDLAKIVDDLSGLTVLQAAELATMLEDKWGVSAAAAVAAAAPASAAPAAEEQTEFTVILKATGFCPDDRLPPTGQSGGWCG